MKEIRPLPALDATVSVPGSKSYTQRALVIAALAEGGTRLINPLFAEDTNYMMDALRALGAGIEREGGDILVRGTAGKITSPGRDIFLGNNGTALRFLTSLAALGTGRFVLTGEKRLCERPVKPLLDVLTGLGVKVQTEKGLGFPPVAIEAGGIEGGEALFVNAASSQYVSSLLISAPYARGDLRIRLSGRTVSLPYIEMTVQAMRRFGAQVTGEEGGYLVKAGRKYGGMTYLVEGDASTASYFFLAAALCRGRMEVRNVNPLSLQGDMGILGIMEKLGCEVKRGEDRAEIKGGPLVKGDYVFDMGDMPDAVPTLAVLAAFREGKTVITNVAHLRIKESNRIAALVSEVRRMGVHAEEREDGLAIEGGRPQGAEIETYNDHRIAMSFAVAGLAAPGMRILNERCVNKSFPAFWDELEKLYV